MAAWDAGGEGEPLLVLLHGLGATRQVFRPMLEQACWKGRWLAIDLPGHGGSPPSCDYSPEAQAACALARSGTPIASIVMFCLTRSIVAMNASVSSALSG